MNDSKSQIRSKRFGKKAKIERRKAKRRAQTSELSFESVENLIIAAAHAHAIGLPLNRFVTINFAAGGCTKRTQEALGLFLKQASDWLKTKGACPAWVWVAESPPDATDHVHILMHVPEGLRDRFARLERRWVKRTGTTVRAKVIKCRHVVEDINVVKDPLRYMLKGCNAENREVFGIVTDRPPQGTIEGKRCGFSQSLGPSARARSNGVLGSSERPVSPAK